MGLVDRDDGWRMPDWLWVKIEPLLPAPPRAPARAVTTRGSPTATRWTRSSSSCAPGCSGTR